MLKPRRCAAPGKRAQGATMYVTLEPCSHQGKTPPCADAIIRGGHRARRFRAGGSQSGGRRAGSRAAARQGHRGRYRSRRRRGARAHMPATSCASLKARPHVTLKLAISADGKAGLAGRKQTAITGEAARERVFQMRAASDAILVGIGTVLSDDPQLTCRLPGMFGARRFASCLTRDCVCHCRIQSSRPCVKRQPGFSLHPRHLRLQRKSFNKGAARFFELMRAAVSSMSAQVLKTLSDQGITRLDGRRWTDGRGQFRQCGSC